MKFHPKNVDYFAMGIITRDELIALGEREYFPDAIADYVVSNQVDEGVLNELVKLIENDNIEICDIVDKFLEE